MEDEDIRKIWRDSPSLLESVGESQEEDEEGYYETKYGRFCRALAIGFDVDEELIDEIANRDFLEMPDEKKSEMKVNYFQLASCETEEHDPIQEISNYLFNSTETRYHDEPYGFSKKEIALRKKFHVMMKKKYSSKKHYYKRVARVLFMKKFPKEYRY